MLVKQLKFTQFKNSSSTLAFKGFLLKSLGAIVNVDFTITKPQPIVNGTLSQFIIKEATNYSLLNSIVFSNTEYNKDTFEIIITLDTEVDIDNIQCVCGSVEREHFKHIRIDYKANIGPWQRFNELNTIPEFVANNRGINRSTVYNMVAAAATNFRNREKINPTSAGFNFALKNNKVMTKGKHFIEYTFKNINNATAGSHRMALGVCAETNDLSTLLYLTSHKELFWFVFGSGRFSIQVVAGNMATTVYNNALYGVPVTDAVNSPEITIGVYLDLDRRLYRAISNGTTGNFDTDWMELPPFAFGSGINFFVQMANTGIDSEYSFNYPFKFSYPDLTTDYKLDNFHTTEGWKKEELCLVLKPATIDRPERARLDWPWTFKNTQTLDIVTGVNRTKLVGNSLHFHRVAHLNEGNSGYGYFKSQVQIDYPPLQPISKRVYLFSIKDGQVLQMVWSQPLTGEYEFKNIKMQQPYLIYTYDSDEDYNAKIVGPIYPTLMPEFEGKDLTVLK